MNGIEKMMGAEALPDGSTRFRVWAPKARQMAVKIVSFEPRQAPMQRADDGVFEATVQGVVPGDDYLFVIDGVKERSDPCSRHQPVGVHGPSRVTSSAFDWTDGGFPGLVRDNLVIYELHVGTFTAEGTFDAVIGKLSYLRDLGVNAIELMPVAQFPGGRNWGYDGVYAYSPQSSYGGPDGLRRLVDASHAHGIGVVLDVVYNHLGPEGNYLPDFGYYFSNTYRTPWGDAINYDGPESDAVRAYFRDNALYWITDYHMDGLRFDAIHMIFDMSARHFLEETTTAARARAAGLGRSVVLIAESDLNDVRVVQPAEKNGLGFDAQWNDDFHHAAMAAITGARHGYFDEFSKMDDLAKSFREGFVFDGRYSPHRRRRHGRSSANEPPQVFVVCLENHDQVANAFHGRRISETASAARQRLAAAVLLVHPGVPMLFMGQEYGETARFDFFTSYTDPVLVEAVRRGRAEEYRSVGLSHVPDPQSDQTFAGSKLRWELLEEDAHRAMLGLYTDLIALGKGYPVPSDRQSVGIVVRASEAPRYLTVERCDERGNRVLTIMNFEEDAVSIPLDASPGRYGLVLVTEDIRYGGSLEPNGTIGSFDISEGQSITVTCPAACALIYIKPTA